MNPTNVTPSVFKQINKLMVMNFRLGFGPFFTGMIKDMGYIMVLTTIGRRSGRQHRTPVNYAISRGDVYCTAGFGHKADWYRNVMANPTVEVWIGNRRWQGKIERVEDQREWLPLYRQIMINSGFAARAFEGIDPHAISDKELLKMGSDMPVMRIRLEREIRGPGGPGDLLWIWPASVIGAILALTLWWLRRHRHS